MFKSQATFLQCYLLYANAIYIEKVYPSDTFHICFENGKHIKVKGTEIILKKHGDSQSSYSMTTALDLCFNVRKYYEENTLTTCTDNQIHKEEYSYPLFQKGNCYISVNDKNYAREIQEEINTDLNKRCSDCLDNIIEYDIDNINNEAVYDLDTNYYCFDNNIISVTGSDQITEKYGDSSKSSYGYINVKDSCYYAREFFRSKVSNRCEFKNKNYLYFPIRVYGGCFINTNYYNNTKISNELKNYLFTKNCKGCKLGDYSKIQDVSSNSHKNKLTIIINICLFICCCCSILYI